MKPIIIIGAARSGTKMLRGIFASHPEVAVFPSEIDYIWKYGNEKFPTDELTADLARPEVKEHIRNQFHKLSARHRGARIVEKSVSNCLRVAFVNEVFPDAYFVHLIRDGRANVESVRRSWESGVSLKYYMQKFVGLDWVDALNLAPKYLEYHSRRKGLVGSNKGVNGPNFDGIKQLLEDKDFLEVCGIQWRVCVESARNSLLDIPQERVVEIKYEELVTSPQHVVESLFSRVGLNFTQQIRDHIDAQVSDKNLDKWKTHLTDSELARLLPHISVQLKELGYAL